MVNYPKLCREIVGLLIKVRSYEDSEIEKILDRESIVDEKTLEIWKRLTLEVCYSRDYCSFLGVDYANLPKRDIDKIKVFALYLAKENPEIIFPLL